MWLMRRFEKPGWTPWAWGGWFWPIQRYCGTRREEIPCSASEFAEHSAIARRRLGKDCPPDAIRWTDTTRSEEHTSELQSQSNLVCRLLLEKKNTPLRPLSRTS